MTAATGTVVSINYTLKDKDGNEIDSSVGAEPLEFVQGACYLLPKLEEQIAGKNPGDKFSTVISAKDGYGEYDSGKVVKVPRSDFETDVDIEVGMQFQAQTEDGFAIVRVTEVSDDLVTVDANHELAGKELHFDIEVVDVREASEDELASGRVGGFSCGGCGGCGGDCGSDCGDCGSGCSGCGCN
jgi:FKBP-type peptidyl-prolyl cis-trans isomerase SlyD